MSCKYSVNAGGEEKMFFEVPRDGTLSILSNPTHQIKRESEKYCQIGQSNTQEVGLHVKRM
jgi:hypothetical protein